MKKTVSLLLVISVFISLIFTSGALAAFKGDVNGDDEVNNKDVVTMFRYVSGSEKAENESAYDYNGDGEVDNKDVVSLFRFVSSGAEPEELEPEPEPTPDDYFEFTLLNNGTYEIMAKDKNNLPKDLVIPRKHSGKAVTMIAVDAFSESDIESVVIGKNVVTVKEYAFWKCQKLNSVTLPAGLHTIEKEAFKACDSLTSAIFGAQDGWDKFNEDILSNTSAAAGKLKSEFSVWTHHIWGDPVIETESTCTQNGYYNHTCTVCGAYEEYYVYATGHDFDENDVCKKCGVHYTPTDDSYFEFSRLDDGTYEIKVKSSVWQMPTAVMLPKTHNGRPVTSIGYSAFSACRGLTSVTIPDGITSIRAGAFSYCSSLTSVTIPSSVMSIGENAFDGCDNLSFNEYDNALYLGNTNNPYHALIYVKNVESVSINEKTNIIVKNAFDDCWNLRNVTIPGSITTIYNYMFSELDITNVTICDGVKSIEDFAFFRCAAIISVTIPASVTSIGEGTFTTCGSLENITVSDENEVYHLGGNCLIETESKTLIAGCNNSVIPDDGSVTSICSGAFSYRESLTSVTIPDSVTSIGEGAFNSCSSLTSVTIGNGMTSISNGMFSGCSSLTSITIPDSVTEIGDYSFYYCSSLADITYKGTYSQWQSISKGFWWYHNSGNYTLHCSDGDYAKDGKKL